VNLAAIVKSVLDDAPAEIKQAVVFRDKDGNAARGICTVVAGAANRSDDLDGFKAGAMVSEKTRRLTLHPDGLAFVPKAGHTVTLEDETVWNVVGCTPLAPGGVLVYYRVRIAR